MKGRFPIAAQHRHRKSGLAARVLSLQIDAELDQQIEDVIPLSAHRKIKRREPTLKARQTAIEKLRILLDERSYQVQVAHANRGEDVVVRAALDQERPQFLA